MNAIYTAVSVLAQDTSFGTEKASDYGPGFLGFVFTAVVVIGAVFLMRDMIRRVRRVRYQSEAEERQQQMVDKGQNRKLQEPETEVDPKTQED